MWDLTSDQNHSPSIVWYNGAIWSPPHAGLIKALIRLPFYYNHVGVLNLFVFIYIYGYILIVSGITAAGVFYFFCVCIYFPIFYILFVVLLLICIFLDMFHFCAKTA